MRMTVILALCVTFLGTGASLRAEEQEYYSAVAYSRKTQRYGYSYGHRSKEAAEKAAVKHCNDPDAKAHSSRANGWCVLVITKNGGSGYGWAKTAKEAEEFARRHAPMGEVKTVIPAYSRWGKGSIKITLPTTKATYKVIGPNATQGKEVSKNGTVRVFRTPQLVIGEEYEFTVTVTYRQRGVMVSSGLVVTAKAGETTEADFGDTDDRR